MARTITDASRWLLRTGRMWFGAFVAVILTHATVNY
jgi:hypothetical protein